MLPGEPLDDRSGIYPRRWRQSVPRLVRFPRSPGCGESDDRAVAARTRQCVERQMDRRRTWRIPDRLGTGLPALSDAGRRGRSEEQPSELQSLMRISYAVLRLKKT